MTLLLYSSSLPPSLGPSLLLIPPPSLLLSFESGTFGIPSVVSGEKIYSAYGIHTTEKSSRCSARTNVQVRKTRHYESLSVSDALMQLLYVSLRNIRYDEGMSFGVELFSLKLH